MRAVYDFIALMLAALVGVVSSYTLPLTSSVSTFLAVCGIWLLVTGPMIPSLKNFGVSGRVARSSLGGILITVAAALHLYSVGAEARLILIAVLVIAIAVTLYLYKLPR